MSKPKPSISKQGRQAITGLHDYCNDLSEGIETFEAGIVAHARHDETARRLATIPGIGPITASLIAATVGDIGLETLDLVEQLAAVGAACVPPSRGRYYRYGRWHYY
jgi:hypothetical protein